MQNQFKNAVMMGLRYIGLPTAALIAKNKIKFHGVDVQQKVVDVINEMKIHVIEPELDGLINSVVSSKYLEVSIETIEANTFLIASNTFLK